MKHVVDNLRLIVIYATILIIGSCLPEEIPEPIACFEPSVTNANIGEQITFSSACSENETQYGWKFGDGEISTEQNPVHVYETPGEYEVSLKVFHKNLSDETSIFIEVGGNNPEPCFSSNDTITRVGDTVYFNNCSNYANEYLWEFGDGVTSTEENPWHKYKSPGMYTVSLTATNEFSSIKETKTGYIKISEQGVANINTLEVTAITTTSAQSGGNVLDDGGAEITARGVCWGTDQNPTIANNKTTDGTGIGEFVSNLSGLTANTTYYVRAYATNSAGTAYGNELSFTTLNGGGVDNETEVVDVTNPATGKTWMDRNLGASQVAKSSTDAEAYGDLYQWGRGADGHQKRNSGTTTTLSSTDIPGHGYFILPKNETLDWRSPQNDNLWQGVNGVNNPCPSGYRLPTEAEWDAEKTSWGSNYAAGAFASPLKLPLAGFRASYANGSVDNEGSYAYYWSSTVEGGNSHQLVFSGGNAVIVNTFRGDGLSVRCIKDATTTPTATVTTATISNIAQNTATGGGEVTNDGGSTITTRGVCWSTNQNPTIADNTTSDGSGTGDFTSNLTQLIANTTYYVRAYATNSEGTAYGNEVSFTTLAESGGGDDTEVVDVINPTTGKTWMDRNLGATQKAASSNDANAYGDMYQWGRAADGHEKRTSNTTSILSNSDTPGHGDFIYAKESPYDWRTPQNDNLWQGVSGINNPCPSGYRIPTKAEWDAEFATWSSNDPAGAIASPIKLTLAGYRSYYDGRIDAVGSFGAYWSSTVSRTYTWSLGIRSNSVSMDEGRRVSGLSVRCIKDAATAATPTVTTSAITDIAQTTATGGGEVSSNGGATVTARGVCWSTNQTPTITDNTTSDGSGTGTFNSSLTGLTANTTYYVRAYATNSAGTAYGSEISFTTLAENGGGGETEVVDVTNPTTGKTWMDRNLGASQAATSSTDTEAYGDLYQWGRGKDGHEKRNSSTTSTLSNGDVPGHGNFVIAPNSPYDWRNPQNDDLWQGEDGINNPCPDGYRIPTYAEWDAEKTSWSSNDAQGALSSPLKLTVAGSRLYSTGSFHNVGSSGYYWSSNVDGIFSMMLYFTSSQVNFSSNRRTGGYSVRCIKHEEISANATLTTSATTNVTQNSATSGGDITDDGGATVTARGVCWSTSQNPTTADNITSDGSGVGTFTSSLTGLTANTTYYVRAYATNSVGTAYGTELSFTTLEDISIPTVTTGAISSITETTATGVSDITDNGGASVTARGMCWSTNPTPTTADNTTNDGTGTGSFTSSLTGLTATTTYYVRAFATNSEGTAYGDEISFTTVNSGEVFNPATGKIWMDRNLGATQVATSSTDVDAYGDLYQWGRGTDGHEKRTSGVTSTLSNSYSPGHGDFIATTTSHDWLSSPNDNLWQGIDGINNPCPSGYRLPTEVEWQEEADSWVNMGIAEAHNSPLKLPLGGFRYGSDGSFDVVGSWGCYWSSTIDGTSYGRYIYFTQSQSVTYSSYSRNAGYSVRCIKD